LIPAYNGRIAACLSLASEDPFPMQLTDQGRQKIEELARRYGVSADAVVTLLQAVVNGNGSMAQFSHPELGGGGQWMRGGMTMVGDMFNSGLKAKVDGLCSELSQLLAEQPFVPAPSIQSQSQGGQSGTSLFVPEPPGRAGGQWWPAELGSPNGAGGQNQIRYAYFNGARRLAVDLGGHVTVYDTLDNQIGGVSQQQGGGSSLTLTSQYGTVSVSSLPVISVDGVSVDRVPRSASAPTPAPAPAASSAPAAPPPVAPSAPRGGETGEEADIFAKIERLADLHKKGILSEQEFSTKKAELLARL
jgi:Short C-terminal domain